MHKNKVFGQAGEGAKDAGRAADFFIPIYIGVLTPNMSGSIITNQNT